MKKIRIVYQQSKTTPELIEQRLTKAFEILFQEANKKRVPKIFV
jgi:hypothetical protein